MTPGASTSTWSALQTTIFRRRACSYLPVRRSRNTPRRSAIGSYLLATASAQALGFIGREEMVERLTATLDTLERLPRHRGHWLVALRHTVARAVSAGPISTVESGTLCALLVTVASACEALATTVPTAAAAEQCIAPLGGPPARDRCAARRQRGAWPRSSSWAPRSRSARRAARKSSLRGSRRVQLALGEFATLELEVGRADENAPLWLLRDHAAMLLSALRDLAPDAAASPQRLRGSPSVAAGSPWRPTSPFCTTRRAACCTAAGAVDAQRSDGGHHELLASEARLTSLFAIANGDVPAAHWHALGRPAQGRHGMTGLRSAAGVDGRVPGADAAAGGATRQSARRGGAQRRAGAAGACAVTRHAVGRVGIGHRRTRCRPGVCAGHPRRGSARHARDERRRAGGGAACQCDGAVDRTGRGGGESAPPAGDRRPWRDGLHRCDRLHAAPPGARRQAGVRVRPISQAIRRSAWWRSATC